MRKAARLASEALSRRMSRQRHIPLGRGHRSSVPAQRFEESEHSQSLVPSHSVLRRTTTITARWKSIMKRFRRELRGKSALTLSLSQFSLLEQYSLTHLPAFKLMFGKGGRDRVSCAGPPLSGGLVGCPHGRHFKWSDVTVSRFETHSFQVDHQPSFASTISWVVDGLATSGSQWVDWNLPALAQRLYGAVALRCTDPLGEELGACHPSPFRQIARDTVDQIMSGERALSSF